LSRNPISQLMNYCDPSWPIPFEKRACRKLAASVQKGFPFDPLVLEGVILESAFQTLATLGRGKKILGARELILFWERRRTTELTDRIVTSNQQVAVALEPSPFLEALASELDLPRLQLTPLT